jgi:hypothetical protein
MNSKTFVGALCLSVGLTGGLAAQAASQNPTQQPQTDTTAQHQTVTVEGCLVLEKDVPGRQPNVAERAGAMEDYILTEAKVVKGGHASATGTAGATGTSGEAASTSSVAKKMFEIRGIDDEQLKQFVGQRVQIEGKLDPADMVERAREQASPTGEPAGDLPELQGTTIRKSTSTEPCTPGADKK